MYSFFRIMWILALPLLDADEMIVPADYNKSLRPVTEDGGPVTVGVSLKINGVQEVNIDKMSVLFDMNLRLSWKDPRLNFPFSWYNSSQSRSSSSDNDAEGESKDEESMAISTEILNELWVPDHFFRRTRSIKSSALLQKAQGLVVYSNKTIYTSSVLQAEVGCPMSFVHFPFDEQKCSIYMGSYFHKINEIEFVWLSSGLSVDQRVYTQLASYSVRIHRNERTICTCSKCVPKFSACIQVFFDLKRRYMVHLLSYYIPSCLFVGVSWASFFWPADVIPGRTVLVITSLLTVSSLYASSREDSPTTSYVKALDTWMFLSILLSASALFEYAIVLQWLKKQELKSKKVQPFTKTVKWETEQCILRDKYIAYQQRTEFIGRIGMPLVYFIFNLIYWPYYL